MILSNARVVTASEVLEHGVVRIEGDRIAAVHAVTGRDHDPGDRRASPDGSAEAPGGRGSAETHAGGTAAQRDSRAKPSVHDLGGRYVVPGFVDMHVHGGGGGSYTSGDPEEARRAAQFHLTHGTTTSLGSLVSAPLTDLARQIAAVRPLVQDGTLAGIHLEGPYISAARCGAHNPADLRSPDIDELGRLLDAGDGIIRMITIAPELPGALSFIEEVVTAGAIAAIGHTDATYAEARAAIHAGARVGTHLFNAMRGLHHREPGPIAALTESPVVAVELINDGVHVHPAVARLAATVVGADRLALVTDAMQAAGLGDGTYQLGSMPVHVEGGVARLAAGGAIAGSTLTMDAALRRAVKDVGLPLVSAARAAAATPARILGRADQIGSIAQGLRADLVVLDDDLAVLRVMRAGQWV